jgi:simple sugar transport system ATP-binding protein
MPPAPLPAPEIELRGITVRFGPTTALDDVSLTLLPAERHAVVGENGAGKSTLMKVLFGLLAPDTGTVVVDGRPRRFSSPADAMALGIGMVQQHFELVPPLTVTENVTLGREVTRTHGLVLDSAGADATVRRLAETSGLPIDPRMRVSDLSVAAQQRVEILKALYRGARVLILDEPTAVLSPAEARDLWRTTSKLAAEGTTIVFVTHKLDEVMANADRVTVLRRGRHILTTTIATTRASELASAMIGSAGDEASTPITQTEEAADTGGSDTRDALSRGLSLRAITVLGSHGTVAVEDLSLDVAAGEIVGLAGVDGSGQIELVDAILGLHPLARGSIRVAGEDVTDRSVAERRAAGVAFIPEDRHHRALILPLACEENVVLGRHREPCFTVAGRLLRRRAMRAFLAERAATFDVRGAELGVPARALSGGNQQKLVLARELSTAPRVLIASQPTRGLDFAASAFVHDALRRARDGGAAILLQSLDLGERQELADRIAVMLRGRIVAVLDRGMADEERIGALMMGAV